VCVDLHQLTGRHAQQRSGTSDGQRQLDADLAPGHREQDR
jgi:hypothetical protein